MKREDYEQLIGGDPPQRADGVERAVCENCSTEARATPRDPLYRLQTSPPQIWCAVCATDLRSVQEAFRQLERNQRLRVPELPGGRHDPRSMQVTFWRMTEAARSYGVSRPSRG